MIPVETGTPDRFRAVLELLQATGYTERAVCERLRMPEISSFIDGHRPVFAPGPPDALDLLIRAFFVGAYIQAADAARLFPPAALEAMLSLKLLGLDDVHRQLLSSPVMLYPVHGIYAASDRYTSPNGEPIETGDDFVFPGISPHTGHFLAVIPESRCGYFLDVGAGAGMAALGAAARYARHAWALDITARSTEYALWNKALNGLDNVTALRGDMFAPVEGLTFDRIVMHPPYDLNISRRQVYCNGGEDGEGIVRRLFQEVGPYLRPGGRLICVARIADLFTAPLEERVREWLGPYASECDVALIVRELASPDDVALGTFFSSRASHDELADCKARLAALGVEGLAYGCIVVQRRLERRETFTVRRDKGANWSSSEIESLIALETALAVDPARIRDMPLAASPELELVVRHVMRNGRLTPASFLFELKNPFKVEMEVQRGIVQIVSSCDSSRTASELYSAMTASGQFPREADESAFLEIVMGLVSAGLLVDARELAQSGKPVHEALA